MGNLEDCHNSSQRLNIITLAGGSSEAHFLLSARVQLSKIPRQIFWGPYFTHDLHLVDMSFQIKSSSFLVKMYLQILCKVPTSLFITWRKMKYAFFMVISGILTCLSNSYLEFLKIVSVTKVQKKK